MRKSSAFLIIAVAVFGLSGFASIPASLHDWAQRTFIRMAFYYYLHQDKNEIERESKSGESGTYYFTSYYLNGMISGAEALQSDYVMKRVVRTLDNMMDTVQTITFEGKPYQAWGPFAMAPNTDVPKPNVHYTLQATVPVARAAATILANPKWKDKYGRNAQRYIAFANSAVMQYWYITRFERKVPWLDVEHVPIWNDNATNMGLVATYLYKATGNELPREVAMAVGTAFKAKLSPSERGWIWESHTIPIGSDTDNTPGSVGNQAGVPDTSHTNREPFFVISMYEAGLMFDRETIDRMAYTFLDHIWNQSYDDPSFANYMNGSNKPYRVYKEPGLNGPIYHGWSFVGGYSPEAQRVLFATVKAIAKGKNNPGLRRNSTSYGGKLGLTGHMLRNYRVLAKGGAAPNPSANPAVSPAAVPTAEPAVETPKAPAPAAAPAAAVKTPTAPKTPAFVAEPDPSEFPVVPESPTVPTMPAAPPVSTGAPESPVPTAVH